MNFDALPQISLRGLPPGSTLAEAVASVVGHSAFDGQLSPPFAVLKRSAVDHNAAWMEAFLEKCGATLAPHGKTSMSPEIFRWQLEKGSEWLTIASVSQARVARLAGANRVLIANQVISAPELDYLVREMNRDESFTAVCFVDSLAGVELAAAAVSRNGGKRPLEFMLEVGVLGGRAGVRDMRTALQIAEAVAASPSLALVGVAGYEGVFSPRDDDAIENVDRYLDAIVNIAEACAAAGLFQGPEVTLSAGGSKFFDRVAERFGRVTLDRPVRVQLRCGCYLFHDIGIYAEAMQLLRARCSFAADLGPLHPALEVWASIQSRPEPGRAIVTMGRRDVSYDAGLPVPLFVLRQGWSRPSPMPEGCRLVKLNDQHGFLDIPPSADVEVGDAVGFGISHPCTVFDKWNALYVVDDTYVVDQIVRTYFS